VSRPSRKRGVAGKRLVDHDARDALILAVAQGLGQDGLAVAGAGALAGGIAGGAGHEAAGRVAGRAGFESIHDKPPGKRFVHCMFLVNEAQYPRIVMPGLDPGIHVFAVMTESRGWPGQARP
jgi:hypothetical protein